MASRHHPLPVVMALLKFVSPSRPFAVYHHLLDVRMYGMGREEEEERGEGRGGEGGEGEARGVEGRGGG